MSFADYADHRCDEPPVRCFKEAEHCKDCDRLIEPITLVPKGRKPFRSCHRCIDRRATAMYAVERATTVEIVVAAPAEMAVA